MRTHSPKAVGDMRLGIGRQRIRGLGRPRSPAAFTEVPCADFVAEVGERAGGAVALPVVAVRSNGTAASTHWH
jgi:hypothetical protein